MELYFLEIGAVLIIASIIGVFFKAIRQPLILAYIFTGLLLGPFFLKIVVSEEIVQTFSSIGITFLLFLVGLELDVRRLKNIGKASLITALGYFVSGAGIGYLMGVAFGFTHLVSFYIGLALALSSTVIVVKMLSESKSHNSLYGKITIGILIVQDVIAIIALIVLDALKEGNISDITPFLFVFVKAAILIAVVFLVSTYLLPRIFRYIAKSQELLFVLSISWAFLISIFSYRFGLSIEIGAFVAGLSLAYLPYAYEIVTRVKSLRDFFLILFFVALGTHITPEIFTNFYIILGLSLFVLLIQPILIMIIMGSIGYSSRTSFMTGTALAQVSEFSLVIMGLGLSLGHFGSDVVSLVTTVAIITIVISTYYITFSDRIYHFLKPYLKIFEKRNIKDNTIPVELKIKDHVIVVGHHVMGSRITKKLKEMNKKVLVVDFDPDVVCDLDKEKDKKTQCLYGDIEDVEVLEKIGLAKASMLVSTVPNLRTNLFLIREAKRLNREIIILVATGETKDAFELYKAGADYVILPYVLGGEHSSLLIQKIEEDKGHLKKLREAHLDELRRDANLYSFF